MGKAWGQRLAVVIAAGVCVSGASYSPAGEGSALAIALPLATGGCAALAVFGAGGRTLRSVVVGVAPVALAWVWLSLSPDAEARLTPAYVSLVALLVVLAPMVLRTLRRLGRIAWRELALFAALAAALGAFEARYLIEAQPIQFSDFMICRSMAIQIAEAFRAGAFFAPVKALIKSWADEYSLLSALAPGLALSASPLSRIAFQAALTLSYAAPAMLALGFWATRVGMAAGARGCLAALALTTALACVAAPGAITAVAFGMPDIGGVALVILALHLTDRLVAALQLKSKHDAAINRAAIYAGARLSAALFAMFLFRRWYLFAVAGVGVAALIELALVSSRLRWRTALASAGAGAATMLVLATPILFSWVADWKDHDYSAIYAGYNYDLAELLRRFGKWYGLGVATLALGCAGVLLVVKADNRPLRLTILSSVVAGALELHVQSPSLQHFYLLLPLLTVPIGALALIVPRHAAFAGVALAVLTLTPIGPWMGAGAALPTASLPPAPRADLAELTRLRSWIEANATPEKRYCVLGSSEIVSSVLVDELWQFEPVRRPVFNAPKSSTIILPQVDARDGPVGKDFERCAYLLVADPVQTSLPPDFMWSQALPAQEVLTGQGIGERFSRMGETFHLIGGVDLIAFSRVRPVTDEDIEALTGRWGAAPRSETARQSAARFL